VRDVTPVAIEDWPSAISLNWQPPRQTNGQITGILLLITVDSTPRLGVYYFLSLTLSVCMYVCLSVTLLLQIASFLFLDGIEPFFGRQFSMWHSTKLFSSIFTVRRYALHGICYRNSVCLSVRLSVCHTRGLCSHGSTYDHDFFTVW